MEVETPEAPFTPDSCLQPLSFTSHLLRSVILILSEAQIWVIFLPHLTDDYDHDDLQIF